MWPDLGSYHKARLNAGVQLLPEAEITAIETVGGFGSDENLTLRTTDIAKCVTKTMFPEADYGQLSPNAIRQKTQEILNELQPDVVVVCGYSLLEAKRALLWCGKNNVPCALMADSTECDAPRHFAKEWLKGRLVRCFSSALVGGKPQKDYIINLGMAPDRVFTGYDAVDNDYFSRQTEVVRAKDDDCRVEHRLPPRYFLSSNRFIPKKNLFRLLQAYAKYREGMNDAWDLVLLGDGELMPQVRQSILELNLQKCVSLPGFKQYGELPVYYALANCFILASTSEQWGLVVNEAMASGLPVLVSKRCGCAPDLVEDGKNGFLIDPFSVENMAEKMVRIMRLTETERKSMGQRSREIIANWGPERFAQGLRAAVEKALGIGPKKVSAFDRLFIKALMLKR